MTSPYLQPHLVDLLLQPCDVGFILGAAAGAEHAQLRLWIQVEALESRVHDLDLQSVLLLWAELGEGDD